MSTSCYHLITNPGLEHAVIREVLTPGSVWEPLLGEPPTPGEPMSGVVEIRSTGPHKAIGAALLQLRTIYHAVEIRATSTLTPQALSDRRVLTAELTAALDQGDFPELQGGASLAVRCRRRGTHPLQSPDIEREAGSALVRRYRCPVRLSAPDITVRVEVNGSALTAGILRTPPEMDHRYHWLYRPRVTLNTVVAAALVQWERRETTCSGALLDPFCGSGTILLEAARHSPRTLYGGDNNPEAVAGTRANLTCNGLGNAAMVRCSDATRVDQFTRVWADRNITGIVCNPPFGVRLGKGVNFHRFYRDFLTGAAAVLPSGGILIMMSSRRRGVLNEVLHNVPHWDPPQVQLIETTGVFPGIFFLRRR